MSTFKIAPPSATGFADRTGLFNVGKPAEASHWQANQRPQLNRVSHKDTFRVPQNLKGIFTLCDGPWACLCRCSIALNILEGRLRSFSPITCQIESSWRGYCQVPHEMLSTAEMTTSSFFPFFFFPRILSIKESRLRELSSRLLLPEQASVNITFVKLQLSITVKMLLTFILSFVIALVAAVPSPELNVRANKPVNETTCAGKHYKYNGLAGYGFIPSNARDRFGDTIGGIGSSAALDLKAWRQTGKNTYKGIIWTLPDRGWLDLRFTRQECLANFAFQEYPRYPELSKPSSQNWLYFDSQTRRESDESFKAQFGSRVS